MKHVLIELALLTFLAAPVAAQTDYQIGAQDVLTITVFGEADLSGKQSPSSRTGPSPSPDRTRDGRQRHASHPEQDLKKRLADGYTENRR
jgi:protein involved in polysaccharide export with SLBB domain